MSRRIKFLVIALLVALVPLRAIAWAAMPCCESGEGGIVKPLKAVEEKATCHEPEPASEPDDGCAFCVVHCVSGAQAMTSGAAGEFHPARPGRVDFDFRSFAAIVLGQPERPPLVS
jgi:hypothetical protein